MLEQIAVVHFAKGWRILCEGQWRGRFEFGVDAVDEALKLAASGLRRGARIDLLVQDRFGEMSPFPLGRPADVTDFSVAGAARG